MGGGMREEGGRSQVSTTTRRRPIWGQYEEAGGRREEGRGCREAEG